jgi:membrane fusion protein (multidrug efflux system)
MLMIVELIKNRRESLVIPEQALMPNGTQQFVYVVGNDNTVERREVKIGSRRPGFVEVVSGLLEGDRVVTDGTIQVRPGATVEILVPDDASDAMPTAGAH